MGEGNYEESAAGKALRVEKNNVLRKPIGCEAETEDGGSVRVVSVAAMQGKNVGVGGTPKKKGNKTQKNWGGGRQEKKCLGTVRRKKERNTPGLHDCTHYKGKPVIGSYRL